MTWGRNNFVLGQKALMRNIGNREEGGQAGREKKKCQSSERVERDWLMYEMAIKSLKLLPHIFVRKILIRNGVRVALVP